MCVSLDKHGMILWAQLERGSQSRTWAGRKEAAILERHGWGGRGNFNVKNGLKMVKVRMTHEQIREAGLLNTLIPEHSHSALWGREGLSGIQQEEHRSGWERGRKSQSGKVKEREENRYREF